LEKRRFQAVRLWGQGLNQSEAARRLHVARQTLARWAHDFRAGGKDGLRKAGRAGRKPLLTGSDRVRLTELLSKRKTMRLLARTLTAHSPFVPPLSG